MTDIKHEGETRPAATLIVARANASGAPRFLIAERAAGMAFAGGAMVFPGGAVDQADRAYAGHLYPSGDVDDMASRIAAVREALEECGLCLAADRGRLSPEAVPEMRAALKAGRTLADIVSATRLSFDFEGLVPFARWCPPADRAHKRFDTRFYIAVARDEHHRDLTPDGGETVSLGWHSAREVLDRADAGRAKIIFPTRRNLERLAQFDSIEALLDHARAYPPRMISPRIELRNGEKHLCIPEDAGYPVTSEPLESAMRG